MPRRGRANLRLSRGLPGGLAKQRQPITSRTAIDHLTAPNKVLNLRVTHFLSDDANERANRGRLERIFIIGLDPARARTQNAFI